MTTTVVDESLVPFEDLSGIDINPVGHRSRYDQRPIRYWQLLIILKRPIILFWPLCVRFISLWMIHPPPNLIPVLTPLLATVIVITLHRPPTRLLVRHQFRLVFRSCPTNPIAEPHEERRLRFGIYTAAICRRARGSKVYRLNPVKNCRYPRQDLVVKQLGRKVNVHFPVRW